MNDIDTLFSSGRIRPAAVGQTLDQLAHGSATKAVSEGRLPEDQFDAYKAKVRSGLDRHTGDLEQLAYRSTGSVDAPVSPAEVGLKGVEGVATPYLTGNAIHYGQRVAAPLLSQHAIPWINESFVNHLRSKTLNVDRKGRYNPDRTKLVIDRAIRRQFPRPTLASAARSFLTPSLPGVAMSQLMGLARPLSDPKYRRGERGYASSWLEGQKGDAERLGRKAEEATQRYGVAGVPLQLLHGFLNPVSSLVYGGTAIKDYFNRGNADKATQAVGSALG